ncbi:hypothetical protein B0H21DRAFT_819381 [Amylocystis lapponica]|nr:hypothetical protein B0H21DRAFT_819381 [Amylocystis lapponica]
MRPAPPTAAAAASPASFPPFAPHLTLASAPASAAPAALAAAVPADTRAVPVRFAALEAGHTYFMSVYVAAQHTPALAALRSHLARALGERAVPPVPHLSLHYVDDADAALRARAKADLEDAGRVRGGGAGVALDCAAEAGADGADVLEGFDGEEIWVVRCEGPVPSWEVLQKVVLAKPL